MEPAFSRWHRVLVALGLFVAGGLLFRSPGSDVVTLELGRFHAGNLDDQWSRPAGMRGPGGEEGPPTYRSIVSRGAIHLPLVPGAGTATLWLRASATVRSAVGVFAAGRPIGQVVVAPGVWDRYGVDLPADASGSDGLDVSLSVRPQPLTRGAPADAPELRVAEVALEGRGARLSTTSWMGLAVVLPVAFLLLAVMGVPCAVSLGLVLALALGMRLLESQACLPLLLALPRLGLPALAAGLATGAATRSLAAADRRGLTALVLAGTLGHGVLVFLADFNNTNLDIYVHRATDFADVPLEYGALLRYGSQLPTATQPYGPATYALGESVLIPYSPLPSVFYYALHRAGLDLYWAMTILNVVVAMAVAPVLWWATAWIWDRGAAWLATVLYVLDLATWHHVGRAHAPASFGSALGTAALLYLAAVAGELGSRRRALAAGAILAAAVLGYSSLAVLVGLLGLVLMVLLVVDARGLDPSARRGVALALVAGGLLAGGLYYFHYLPGLVRGAGRVEAEPDLVGLKSFFIFHNESRQNLRLWAEGYWLLLLAGLAAAPFALRRARPEARPVLVAWLAAWALVMLLKEPFLFPKLLRWAKEDQFLSPLLALFVAGSLVGVTHRGWRWALALLAIAVALVLEVRDFRLSAAGAVIL